jgi:hypothetical protein
VLTVDARSSVEVTERLLHPVLEHLARTLPAVDGELLAELGARSVPLRDDLIAAAVATKATLRPVGDPTPHLAESMHLRTADLRRSLRAGLAAEVARLRAGTRTVDPAWTEAVRAIHRDVIGWIGDGFGLGQRQWCERASQTLARAGSAQRFVDAELARMRLGISDRYAGLDGYLVARMDDLFDQVAGVFVTRLGNLLTGMSGRAALRRLAEIAENTAEPCRILPASLRDLLAVPLDYRTHLHPRIGPALDALFPANAAAARTGEDVQQCLARLQERARRVTDRIRADLLGEPSVPAMVVFAAVEQFADVVTRSAAARPELHRITSSHRIAVWPDMAAPIDRADARVAAAIRAADELLDVTTALAAPTLPGRYP